jgi:hypothetical protein
MPARINTRIHGDTWVWEVVEPNTITQHVPSAGTEDAAVTVTRTKTVFIDKDHFNKEVVRHELLHVEAYYFRHGDAGLSNDQLEEVFCSWISTEVIKFSKRATAIYNKLNKLLEGQDESGD